jgi:hypothetical protein
MNAVGAVVINPVSGDPERTAGFVMRTDRPADITVHGNYTKGFYVSFVDAGIEKGPYPDPAIAEAMARMWEGVLERAN